MSSVQAIQRLRVVGHSLIHNMNPFARGFGVLPRLRVPPLSRPSGTLAFSALFSDLPPFVN